MARATRWHWALLASAIAVVAVSGIYPRDQLTWVLEVAPAAAGIALLAATFGRFQFSDLAYGLIWIHVLILAVGGHWTYAEMPLFNMLRDCGACSRNNYDRLGHLAQGFIPAIIGRELLIRTSPLKTGRWLWAMVVMACVGLSGVYELIEWLAAVLLGQAADQFLGSQGDVWDTQADMLCALVGATAALLMLSRMHDRSMAKLAEGPP